ncbi:MULTISPECIES: 23S rRNA (adenine(1618)-N(6))-methyltransferase RlmF [unclassified Leeuwenhoekiella]|uniref:23S rRNA (adenine(1618)-N(6))-methyltransferase RlmF n=1 Tax=unclassified Leeuwenhoekiella TaxID=2615029 RepID=UPI000C694598|nr:MULTISPECIES: 23S rRNA (adenine(1618)-N(6))-methyltransferase RlmF [unclassified Leeuwenhoekiella]MAW96554.1 23S rRNA (adenine(1618)-N(6))-methyltransferase RlmF [Leeuwenhoekiella sp.]MBA81441.1 23S rRNA (adenine(1618)-N(6))-methyltransferase RlmF [Leeuwenhoekiella sp.]|tara:strand:+ start:972 stop:1901 length:930 start_codon:yes stop_codon:yes gene_type:complete
MASSKKTNSREQIKSKLHPRNRNREPYDLNALIDVNPELKNHIKLNKYGNQSVDFANPRSVKLLNTAILNFYYGIEHWEFPEANLVPPIPGRADYLHYIADLLAANTNGKILKGDKIKGLDIGTGASLIYPILGVVEYGWAFTASDIDATSLESAEKIINANEILQQKIDLRLQSDSGSIFKGVINPEEQYSFTMCNPPFHASRDIANQGTRRKVKNLSGSNSGKPDLNFAGVQNELITAGGEPKFIKTMIRESKDFASNCIWFTTLISKKDYLKDIYKHLKKAGAKTVKTIPMGTGNKTSRIVAWTFR